MKLRTTAARGGTGRRARALAPRRTQLAVALAALLWLGSVAAAVLLTDNANRGPRAAPLPRTACAGLELGVHSTLAFDGDPGHRQETVAAIHRFLHPQVVRDSLLWNQIEPREGRLDWSRTDSIVEELRAAGIEPLLVVLGSPSWANGLDESSQENYLHVPTRRSALDRWLHEYSDFLAAAVRRYHDFVRRWEIWNEPNLIDFWRPRPDPASYRHVYETLRATILRVDPTAEVAVGGLGGLGSTSPPSIPGVKFLRQFMSARPPMDAVAIHPYATDGHPPWIHIPNENNFDDIARVHDQLVAAREDAQIWVTEWGWSSAAVGARRQALYLKRSLEMLERRYRFVRLATYFVDRDRPPDLFQGLLDARLEPKPAAGVFRRQADLAALRCQAQLGST